MSSERIKEIREESGCSLIEAKEAAYNENLIDSIRSANSLDEIKELLVDLIEHKF